jgi:N-acetylmuramoyl-L-alanine amidase
MHSCGRRATAAGLAWLAVFAAMPAAAQDAESKYTAALSQEEVLRIDLESRGDSVPTPLLRRLRTLVGEYQEIVRRYPRSGYSDNALYQAALLSADAYWKFGEDPDRRLALRLLKRLRGEYPSSSLVKQIHGHAAKLDAVPVAAVLPRETRPLLIGIRREVLSDALRVTLDLEQEVPFHEERLESPPRVFVDLQNTRAVDTLRDATIGFADDVVRQVRIGRQQGATRVVLDLQGAARHSVYALYDPYRVVIDFERTATGSAAEAKAVQKDAVQKDEPGATWTPAPGRPSPPPAPDDPPAVVPDATPAAAEPVETAKEARPVPSVPSANSKGGFSLSRQLGLGISRVVIDAGHGGHDPGARVKGLSEADLTLDVALRLEKLLLRVPGVEVVMTRRTNVYIPLEERTAIANRAGADLFLSVHANASSNPRARGIETYFLNFAATAEAEAIAARENAGSAKTMHNLPDIVKAIALNNKIDESRDFAGLVQTAMFDRLRRANRDARSLGVKQAPFMVLIGATMPSVLAEISFITNRQEGSLLRTANYRQAIAEALFAGVSKYQRSLKNAATVAAQ